MQKSLWTKVLILGFAPFLLQCTAASGQQSNAALRLRTLETRMTTIEKNTSSLTAQNQGQAEMGLTVDNLEAQMMQIKGRLEEDARQLREIKKENKEGLTSLDHQIDNRIEENNAKIQKQLEERLSEMQKNMAKLADLLNTAMQEIDNMKQVRAKEASESALAAAKAAKEARERAEKQKEQVAAASEPPQPAKNTGLREIAPAQTKKSMSSKDTKESGTKTPEKEMSLYDKGLKLYHSQKYKEAYNTLQDYIEKEPNGKMVPNARFWLGDSLFKQREYELAILEYQKVIADYPKDDKAPAALLKQGLAFERLKDTETAKLVYKKLLEDFPKSDQAVTAKSWLEKH